MDRILGILNRTFEVFFIGILFFITSCKKDKTNVQVKIYDIIDLNFDTNRIVSSIDTFIYHPSGCGMIPFPSDSLDVDSLDLNNDSIYDSYLRAKSWYNATSMSYPCANYCFSLSLNSIQSEIQFSKIGTSGNYQVDTLNFNDVVDLNKDWSFGVIFELNSSSPAPYYTSNKGTHYIGYRVAKGVGYQYGWLKVKSVNNGISIIEGALNRTIDMGIPAGKKQ